MDRYCYSELKKFKRDISEFILNEDKLSTKLLFKLRTNLKKINSAIELIEEDFETLDDEKKEKYHQFQNEQIELIKEYDGEIENLQNGKYEILNHQELNKDEEFRNKLDDLVKEYQDILDSITDINATNNKKAQEEVAEIEFVSIAIDSFPDELSDFPDSFLEFTTQESQFVG